MAGRLSQVIRRPLSSARFANVARVCAQAPAREPGGRLEDVVYGPAVVSKTSVRFAVLPEFACTNTGTNVFPIVASPS